MSPNKKTRCAWCGETQASYEHDVHNEGRHPFIVAHEIPMPLRVWLSVHAWDIGWTLAAVVGGWLVGHFAPWGRT